MKRVSTAKAVSGAMRHFVELQRDRGTQQHTDGSPIEGWETVHRIPCRVEPLTGKALERAMQNVGVVTHEITARYMPGVDKKMRVKFGSRIFGIARVLDGDEQNVEMKLLCNEAV